MEKVGEDKENTIEEASNSVLQETMTRTEDEGSSGVFPELIDPVLDSIEAESTNSAYLHTVTSEDHDVNESQTLISAFLGITLMDPYQFQLMPKKNLYCVLSNARCKQLHGGIAVDSLSFSVLLIHENSGTGNIGLQQTMI